jgi:hypothetical protein
MLNLQGCLAGRCSLITGAEEARVRRLVCEEARVRRLV